MSKKKRNKPYKGSAMAVRPTVTKVSAIKRTPLHQWWIDHRRVAKPALAAGGIALLVIIVVIGIVDLIW